MGNKDFCAVRGCSNTRNRPHLVKKRSHVAEMQWHSTQVVEKKKVWEQLISKGRKDFKFTSTHKVCSNHFLDGSPTHINPNPTLYLTTDSDEQKLDKTKMPMISCCAVGCTNSYKKAPEMNFYRIPTDRTVHRKWTLALKREDWKQGYWTKQRICEQHVCSDHFVSGQRSMDPEDIDFVPSIFNFNHKNIWSSLNCAAVGCTNNTSQIIYDNNGVKISFHRFPLKNKILLGEWLAKMKRIDFGKPFQPAEHSRICSVHFDKTCFEYQTDPPTLKKDGVPSFLQKVRLSAQPRSSHQYKPVISRTVPRLSKDIIIEADEINEEVMDEDYECESDEIYDVSIDHSETNDNDEIKGEKAKISNNVNKASETEQQQNTSKGIHTFLNQENIFKFECLEMIIETHTGETIQIPRHLSKNGFKVTCNLDPAQFKDLTGCNEPNTTLPGSSSVMSSAVMAPCVVSSSAMTPSIMAPVMAAMLSPSAMSSSVMKKTFHSVHQTKQPLYVRAPVNQSNFVHAKDKCSTLLRELCTSYNSDTDHAYSTNTNPKVSSSIGIFSGDSVNFLPTRGEKSKWLSAMPFSSIKMHKRTHIKDRSFKLHYCNICGKGVSHLYNYRTHMATHTREKKHNCSVCQMKFAKWIELYSHRKCHVVAKNHKCDKCGAGFTNQRYLKVHLRTHFRKGKC